MKFEAYQWNQYNQGYTITERLPVKYFAYSDSDLYNIVTLPTSKSYAYIGERENNLCFIHAKNNDVIKVPMQYQKGQLYPVQEEQLLVGAQVAGETEIKDGIVYPDDRETLYTIESGILHKHQITRIIKETKLHGFPQYYARKYIRCIGVTVKPATEMTSEEAAYFRKHYDLSTPQQAYEKEVMEIHGHHYIWNDTFCAVYKFTKEESL